MTALNKGKSVIVSTSTASGKSVIYQVRLELAVYNAVLYHDHV